MKLRNHHLSLLVLISLLSLIPVKATEYCPRVLTVFAQVSSLTQLDPDFLPQAQKLQRELSRQNSLDMRFYLRFSGAGRCHFEGRDSLGNSLQARTQKSQSSSESETILLITSESMAIKANLTNLTEGEISYRVKECETLRCRSQLYPIGRADITLY